MLTNYDLRQTQVHHVYSALIRSIYPLVYIFILFIRRNVVIIVFIAFLENLLKVLLRLSDSSDCLHEAAHL